MKTEGFCAPEFEPVRDAIAYVMNRMAPDLLGDLRGGMIVLAAYKALAG